MTLYVLGTPESLPASLRDEEGNVYPVQPMTGAPIPGGATQSTFVYQPGGVASGNVFTSWPTLYAALNAAAPIDAHGNRSPTIIQIDDSFVSPAVVPPGAYNLNEVELGSVPSTLSANGGAVLQFANGVTLPPGTTGLNLTIGKTLQVIFAGAATCIASTVEVNIYMRENSQLECSGAGKFVVVSGAAAFAVIQMIESSQLGDGVHAVADSGAGGTVEVTAYGNSIVFAGAVTASAGTSEVFWDSFIPGAQGAGVTVAQANGYVPATPANWHPAPTTQSGALDQIAAVGANHVQGIQAFGAAAHAITTANLAHTTVTGHTRCFVSCSVSSAAAGDDIGFQLNLDGVPTGPVMGASSAIIGAAVSVAIQYDFAPAAGAHNYSITATSGAAANLTGIQAIVQVQELLS